MSGQHTPSPWAICPAAQSGIGVAHYTDGKLGAASAALAITGRSAQDGGEGWHYVAAINSHAQAVADAQHIVQCVNAHDELVAALRAAADALPDEGLLTAGNAMKQKEAGRIARAALGKVTGSAA